MPDHRSLTSRVAAAYLRRGAIGRAALGERYPTWHVGTGGSYTVPPPVPEGDVPMLRESVGHHRAPPSLLTDVGEVLVRGWSAVVLTADGRLVWEALQGRKDTLRKAIWDAPIAAAASAAGLRRPWARRRLLRRAAPGGDAADGATLLLHGRQAGGYYHFTLDHLPKLRGTERFEQEHGTRVGLVVPPGGTRPGSWVRQAVEVLGHGDREISEWTATPTSYRRLLVATHRTHSTTRWDTGPADLWWLRRRAWAQVLPERRPAAATTLLYVSRADATRRQVVNEEEVRAALRALGFVVHTLAARPVHEQVALFAAARVVVSPHGAGLTNLVYAPVGTTVVELLPAAFPKPVYQILTAQMGQRHLPLLCPSDPPRTGAPINGDLHVPVDRLRWLVAPLARAPTSRRAPRGDVVPGAGR